MSSSGVMGSDGQLAPVTWLFGAPPAPNAAAPLAEVSASPVQVLQAPEELPSSPLVTPLSVREQRGDFERINNVAMNALARRGMSIAEMRDYLIGREFESADVDSEIERLTGVGLLDDVALAETLVRTLRERKGLGRSGITAELRRRKLESGAIAEALDEPEIDDELQRAIAVAVKRAPQLRSLDQTTAKRRLGAFLMRKGYSGSVVSTAVAAALTPSGGPVFR